MIPQTAEYALRAVVWLADHPGEAQTSRQMAAGTRVPAGYLYKVLQALGRGGVLTSQPGPGGGYALARSPEAISVLDVIRVVEPIPRIHTCPLKLDAHGTNLCALHRKLDDAYATIEAAFAAVSIAELLRTPGDSRPLCEVARPVEESPPVSAPRHAALRPLSRDHHHGLLQATGLLRGAAQPAARRRALATAFARAWREDIEPHFADEERLLLDLLTAADRGRLLDEHARLRALAQEAVGKKGSAPTADWMARTGGLLRDHIRWEEREAFPRVEQRASRAQLDALQAATEAIEARRARAGGRGAKGRG